jgi:CRP/FNR family cyclic AMP-dependent transcriptional regulator
MREILKYCGDIPLQDVAGGTELLAEGQTTGHVYILAKGRIEVLRDGTPVTVIDEPGSLVGEMSVLLGVPHTASVRALGDAKVHVIEDGNAFVSANPQISWLVARLLANRLNAATTYLADLKAQFASHGSHLEMVGEIAHPSAGTRLPSWVRPRFRPLTYGAIRRQKRCSQPILEARWPQQWAAATARQAAQPVRPSPRSRRLRR